MDQSRSGARPGGFFSTGDAVPMGMRFPSIPWTHGMESAAAEVMGLSCHEQDKCSVCLGEIGCLRVIGAAKTISSWTAPESRPLAAWTGPSGLSDGAPGRWGEVQRGERRRGPRCRAPEASVEDEGPV
ncbi:unnamed protein product [Gadus morhua 'NCC']